jgi:hypothetical protein
MARKTKVKREQQLEQALIEGRYCTSQTHRLILSVAEVRL